MVKRQIMIYAYTAHNLGDDLFIHILCQRYPHIQFQLYAPKKYRQTFQKQHNVHIIPSDTRKDKITHHLLPVPKTAIYIGGSIFMEQNNWKKDWRRLKRMKKRHKNFYIIGANFGPYHSNIFYQIYENFFHQCTDVCFRDQISFQEFRHIPQVRYANDVVFTHPVGHEKTSLQTIVISVIFPSIRNDLKGIDEAYFSVLATFAMHCMDKGYNIIWFACCKLEKDDQAITAIYEKIAPTYYDAMSIFHYETNMNAALQIIASAKAVIATRFHAMILGLLYKKPVFAITYSHKMLTVLQDNDLHIPNCNIKEIENVSIQRMFQACQEAPVSIRDQIKQAETQFTLLDADLKDD